MPNAKQDGMMIRPAMTATKVSSAVMLIASPVMERSLDRYEPKIAIEPMPMLSVKND